MDAFDDLERTVLPSDIAKKNNATLPQRSPLCEVNNQAAQLAPHLVAGATKAGASRWLDDGRGGHAAPVRELPFVPSASREASEESVASSDSAADEWLAVAARTLATRSDDLLRRFALADSARRGVVPAVVAAAAMRAVLREALRGTEWEQHIDGATLRDCFPWWSAGAHPSVRYVELIAALVSPTEC